MRSNYKTIGEFIRRSNVRNEDGSIDLLLGVNLDKKFIPSVANINGTDLSKYKVIKKGQFGCKLMSVGRDKKLPISRLIEHDKAIISSAYFVFEVIDENILLPEYLMMWFSRPESDRYLWFQSGGDVRGRVTWEDLCSLPIQVPSIEKQQQIVNEYNAVVNRIKLNEQLNQKLEEICQAVFDSAFEKYNTEDAKSTRLGNLIEIKGGYSYHSSKINQGKSYLLGMGCISFNDRFIESGMRLYSDEFPEKHMVKPLDIIIATRQQSENMPILGYPAMIPEDLINLRLVAASNLYRVVNKSSFNNFLLYQLLRSKAYIEHIKLNTKGTTVGMITKDAIEDYYFTKPSDEVVRITNNKLEILVRALFRNRQEIKKLQELKDLLLSKMTRVEKLEHIN